MLMYYCIIRFIVEKQDVMIQRYKRHIYHIKNEEVKESEAVDHVTRETIICLDHHESFMLQTLTGIHQQDAIYVDSGYSKLCTVI